MVAFSIIEWIILIALISIVFFVTAIITFVKVRNKRWPMNYVIWETVGGSDRQEPTKKGKCRLVSVGDMGEEIYFLDKIKKYRIAWGKKIGKNTIYWAVGQDGLHYNVDIGHFNNNFNSLGLMPVDRDVRYGSTSLRKIMDQKYNKMNNAQKQMMIISFIMLFICILALGGSIWISFSQQNKVAQTNLETSKVNLQAQQQTADILRQIDVIQSGGSGFTTQVTPTP